MGTYKTKYGSCFTAPCLCSYGKCFISNTFLTVFSNKILVTSGIKAGIHKMYVRIGSDCSFRSCLIWVCTVCLDLFGKQLVFKIVEHFPYLVHMGLNHSSQNIKYLFVYSFATGFLLRNGTLYYWNVHLCLSAHCVILYMYIMCDYCIFACISVEEKIQTERSQILRKKPISCGYLI